MDTKTQLKLHYVDSRRSQRLSQYCNWERQSRRRRNFNGRLPINSMARVILQQPIEEHTPNHSSVLSIGCSFLHYLHDSCAYLQAASHMTETRVEFVLNSFIGSLVCDRFICFMKRLEDSCTPPRTSNLTDRL